MELFKASDWMFVSGISVNSNISCCVIPNQQKKIKNVW